MKLLMISGDRAILEGKKGAFWYTLEELRKHWTRIDIICPRPRVENLQSEFAIKPHTERDGVVTFHPNPRSLFWQPWWILRTGRALHADYEFDAMTVHEYPPFYNGLGARWLSKLTGIPYVLEIHHIVGHPRAASFTELVGRYLSRIFLPYDARGAQAVRAVNGDVRKRLTQWKVPAEKIAVIPSFYLDREFYENVPAPPVIYDLAFCGRLVPNKGLAAVIEAVAKLPNCRMVVIGDGPQRAPMEEKVKKLDLEHRVQFVGWLPDREAVIEAVKSARIFVMNSTSEGGPRVLLEAMASGMPVISTPVGVAPDAIQDGRSGLFTTGEPDELARKIEYLLNNEELQKTFSLEARRVLDVYNRTTLMQLYADFVKSFAKSVQSPTA